MRREKRDIPGEHLRSAWAHWKRSFLNFVRDLKKTMHPCTMRPPPSLFCPDALSGQVPWVLLSSHCGPSGAPTTGPRASRRHTRNAVISGRRVTRSFHRIRAFCGRTGRHQHKCVGGEQGASAPEMAFIAKFPTAPSMCKGLLFKPKVWCSPNFGPFDSSENSGKVNMPKKYLLLPHKGQS